MTSTLRLALMLANTRTLLWLNHLLAQHPRLFQFALFLTDKGGDVATLGTMAWLWFWPALRVGEHSRSPRSPVTRQESRARLLVFAAAGVAAYVASRLIAFSLDVNRPFATYLPVHGVPGAFEGLRTFGSFPSDHAALLGALPMALWYWDRRAARIWIVLAGVLATARVAVGFHYPSDMIAGAAVGVAFTAAAMVLYDRRGTVHRVATWIAGLFSRSPQCYVLYGLGALVVLEFAMHFSHLLGLIFMLSSAVHRITRG